MTTEFCRKVTRKRHVQLLALSILVSMEHIGEHLREMPRIYLNSLHLKSNFSYSTSWVQSFNLAKTTKKNCSRKPFKRSWSLATMSQQTVFQRWICNASRPKRVLIRLLEVWITLPVVNIRLNSSNLSLQDSKSCLVRTLIHSWKIIIRHSQTNHLINMTWIRKWFKICMVWMLRHLYKYFWTRKWNYSNSSSRNTEM